MNLPATRFLFAAMRDALATIDPDADRPLLPLPAIIGEGSLPSMFPVTPLAVASVAAAATALAGYMQTSGAPLPAVSVDRRLASFWFGRSLKPLGWQVPPVRNPVTGDYRGKDGWIRIHANAPHHRHRALAVLGCDEDKDAVIAAVADRNVQELEDALVAADACAAVMHSRDEWSAHPQGKAVATAPLMQVESGATGTPTHGRFAANRPLAGVRVLDLTRVLAGPVATRFLAGFGATVLRIDPPSWTEPGVVPEVTLGKVCIGLDLKQSADRERFIELLAGADVLVHGYRPDALDRLGLGAEVRQAIRPGLVDVSLDAWGFGGPWACRRGFDSLVQMSCGIAAAGRDWQACDAPFPLPVQALDHATGYLLAAAIMHALGRQRDGGAGTIVRLALAHTAHLLMSAPTASEAPALHHPESADFDDTIRQTAWGPAQRLRSPCRIDGTPMTWKHGASPLRHVPASAFCW